MDNPFDGTTFLECNIIGNVCGISLLLLSLVIFISDNIIDNSMKTIVLYGKKPIERVIINLGFSPVWWLANSTHDQKGCGFESHLI